MTFLESAAIEIRLQDENVLHIGDKTTNDRIAMTNIALTSDFTVEAWVNLDAHLTGIRQLAFVADLAPNDDVVLIASHEGSSPYNRPQVYVRTSTALWQFVGSKELPIGIWNHLAVSFDEGTSECIMYINGEDDSSATFSGTLIHPSEAKSSIGGHWDGGDSGLGGKVREVRVWTDVRTPTEILDNMNVELTGGESGLLHLWHIDEGTGTTVTDDAGSNDGTITGSTWATNDVGPFWTDITSDVIISAGLRTGYGINGMGPLDRIAGSGQMSFTLDNSASNSGALAGYYTPGHTNARTGFGLNCPVRLVLNGGALTGEPTWGDGIDYSGDYYKFTGKITRLTVIPGTYRMRRTSVECQDFMWEMGKHKMDLLTTGENILSDDLVEEIIGNMTIGPDSVTYNTGQETFIHSGDDLKDEKSTALAALQKTVVSEFGYAYIKGDNVSGGHFVYEDRHHRVNTSADFTFTGSEIQLQPLEMGFDLVFNVVKSNTYPRETDGGFEVLYTLQRAIEVSANGSETFTARYTDPTARSTRMGAKDLQDVEGLNQITANGEERYFEDGIGTWFANGTDSDSVSQNANFAFEGLYSMKLVSGTGAAHTNNVVTGDLLTGFAQNDVIYVQAWVYLESAWPAGVQLGIAEHDVSDVFQTMDEVDITTTVGEWVRLSGTYTVTDADTAKVRPIIGWYESDQNFSGGAVNCYIDDVYLIHDSQINFEFSSTDGGGGDKNGDVYFTNTREALGSNAGEIVANNDSGAIGYLTIFTIDGTALRTYDPIEITKTDADSIAAYGKRELTMSLPYQENHLVGSDFSEYVLSQYKNPQFVVPGAGVVGNSDKALAAAIWLEPGDRITIVDDIGGMNDDYFIQSVNFDLMPNDVVRATWGLIIASAGQSWLLGDAGFSELGETTILGV